MKKKSDIIKVFLLVFFFFIFTLDVFSKSYSEVKLHNYPKLKKEKYKKEVHGDIIVDYYHWLKDVDWRQTTNNHVIDYLKAENNYTEDYFFAYKKQEEKLINEMKRELVEDYYSYPIKRDDYYYYRRFIKGKDEALICRKQKDLQNKEEVLLDINEISSLFPGSRMGAFFVSPGHNFLAYTMDLNGEEKYIIHVKNLSSGKTDSSVVKNMRGNVVWDGNNKGFFYTKLDEALRPTQVLYHEVGADATNDKFIYKEQDGSFLINISKTSDHKYLVIDSYNNTENEVRVVNIEANKQNHSVQLLCPKSEGQECFVDHGHNSFFYKINDKGKNFRLIKINDNSSIKEGEVIEIIPHKEAQSLGGFSLSKDYIAVNIKKNGTKEILVFDKEGASKEIRFEEESFDCYGFFPTYNSEFLRVNYESFTTAPSIMEYDYKDGRIYTRKSKTLGEYDKSQYKSEKIYIKADDGVEVPISLFYRKDKFQKDGTNPLLLYGYGSYGLSKYPYFDKDLFSLVDRGFIYAIAHIRGGSELGYKWYEDAKLLNKKRTFFDYINCAEELINRKYVDPKKLVGYGASAGAMLLGFVMNERPELLRVVVTDVPSVDVLNFMLDDKLPTTPFHYSELGNPKEKKYYEYIKSYSPYDNIKKQKYPAIYVKAGLHDSRVAYWQSTKWVAKLREYNQSSSPILLHMEMNSGHFGQGGRQNALKQKAMMYNFILINLGMLLD